MANEYTVNAADLTSVADAIRTKGGTSAQLVFPSGFVSAIEDIQSGSTVQIATGSYTTNSSGSATVSCGFKPDVIIAKATGAYGTTYGGIAFTEFNITSGGGFLIGSSSSDAYANHAFTQTSNGFSVSAKKYSTSFKESVESNRSVNYVAIKYTE